MAYQTFTSTATYEVRTAEGRTLITIKATNDIGSAFEGKCTVITYWSEDKGQDIPLAVECTADFLEDPDGYLAMAAGRMVGIERAEFVNRID